MPTKATHLEQTTAVPEEVSIDTAIASVTSEVESISSLKEEQRRTLKAFLHVKDIFTLIQLASAKV